MAEIFDAYALADAWDDALAEMAEQRGDEIRTAYAHSWRSGGPHYMEAKQRQLVESLKAQKLPVSFESPDDDFEGRRTCDDAEGINKIVKAPQGDGDFRCTIGGTWCVRRENFHPAGVGTSAYAEAFRRAVSNL